MKGTLKDSSTAKVIFNFSGQGARGWPVLLRTVAGLTLLTQGAAYLNDWRNLRFGALVAVTLVFVGGVSLLAGILTPITSLLVVLGTIGYAFSWLPAPSANLLDSKLVVLDVIAIATAIAFLGRGAYSLDALFFGVVRFLFLPLNVCTSPDTCRSSSAFARSYDE